MASTHNPRASDALTDQVRCCDNLEWLRELPDGLCSLVYIDPPFGTGQRRATASNTGPSYGDPAVDGHSAAEFLRPRLEQIHRVLSESGSLYVHLDWRTVHHVRLVLDDIFGADNFLNEIIWSYRTGGGSRRWFRRKHDNILVYARRIGTRPPAAGGRCAFQSACSGRASSTPRI